MSVFTSRGYVALLPDCLIGPAGQKGNPVQELRDVLIPQILHAGELGYVDPERVALIGQSYGGYCTAALLSATPIFAAGISVSGLYDLPDCLLGPTSAAPTSTRAGPKGARGGWGHAVGGARPICGEFPYYRADKIRTPLLMIHGESDDTCPVADAQKMFGALKRLGAKAQLAVYPGRGTW